MKRSPLFKVVFISLGAIVAIVLLGSMVYFAVTYVLLPEAINKDIVDSSTMQVSSILFFPTPIGHDPVYSNAILISDPDEIRRIIRYVNRGISWSPCFDDIIITFWESPFDRAVVASVDQDCSQYDWRLMTYFQRLRHHPTHHVYNFSVPRGISPQQVYEDFSKKDLVVLSFSGPAPDLPEITVRIQWPLDGSLSDSDELEADGKRYLHSQIDQLRSAYSIVSVDYASCSRACSGSACRCNLSADLKFEVTSSLSGIDEFTEVLGLEISSKDDADYYYLQLVVAESDLSVVRELLKTEFDYVLEVYYFPTSTY